MLLKRLRHNYEIETAAFQRAHALRPQERVHYRMNEHRRGVLSWFDECRAMQITADAVLLARSVRPLAKFGEIPDLVRELPGLPFDFFFAELPKAAYSSGDGYPLTEVGVMVQARARGHRDDPVR